MSADHNDMQFKGHTVDLSILIQLKYLRNRNTSLLKFIKTSEVLTDSFP